MCCEPQLAETQIGRGKVRGDCPGECPGANCPVSGGGKSLREIVRVENVRENAREMMSAVSVRHVRRKRPGGGMSGGNCHWECPSGNVRGRISGGGNVRREILRVERMSGKISGRLSRLSGEVSEERRMELHAGLKVSTYYTLVNTQTRRQHLAGCNIGSAISAENTFVKCVCRNDLPPSKKAPKPPKPPIAPKLATTTHLDTTDGPPAAGQGGPPKMSQVIGQLRRAPPTTAAPNDGDYSSIDLLRTAGARAQSTGGDEATSPVGQPQNIYGPLLMEPQHGQETDPTYSEVETYADPRAQ